MGGGEGWPSWAGLSLFASGDLESGFGASTAFPVCVVSPLQYTGELTPELQELQPGVFLLWGADSSVPTLCPHSQAGVALWE